MKLTILGTGNATVTKIYNTCFILDDDGKLLLVDGGGGNQILGRIKDAGYDWKDIRHIYVTHKHIDHLLGIIWLMRMILQNMAAGTYEGEAYIYSHGEVIGLLRQFASDLLVSKTLKYLDTKLHLVILEDGQVVQPFPGDCATVPTDGISETANGANLREAEDRNSQGEFTPKLTAFDIGSSKAKQFGFMYEYAPGRKLTCCGDEPYNPCEEKYARNADWLLHEAFCLYEDREIFKPYEKHHSTAKDAAELAESLNVKNLILYHTEEKRIQDRERLYLEEGKKYYSGNLYVPEDMTAFLID